MQRTLSGVGLLVRFVGCAVLALTVTGSVRAQTSVVPSGAGTAASPYLISQLGHLVWMGNNVGSSSGKYYTMQNDVDASVTTNWNSGKGFAPIGTNSSASFKGVFDGNGKVISNLKIARPSQNYVGLFGYIGAAGAIKNCSLAGGSVSGSNYVGSIVGVNAGIVSNCRAAVTVAGGAGFGDLGAGGLVGYSISGGTVRNCHATGLVTGSYDVGGLVGANNGGTAVGCYATGAVTGSYDVGGLMGGNYGIDSAVSNCFANGAVVGTGSVGGLVGQSNAKVSDCYATGAVTGSYSVGGLIGFLFNSDATVVRCYATGLVTGGTYFGGLVGDNQFGTITNSYWDTNTTGQAASFGGGTGTNTAAMKQQATFAGWDFANVWRITETVTYPLLRSGTTPSGSGTLVSPYLISGLGNLVWMEENAGSSSGKYFTVQNRIDASGASELNVGTGFSPIGSDASMFQGLFDGNRKVISGLTINRPAQGNVGLFGYVGSVGVVKNLGLEDASVTGSNEVGAIVGWNVGVVRGCHVAGSVTGYSDVGGLVGWNDAAGAVSNCYSTASVNGSYSIGGLVGINSGGALSECYADGPVTGGYYAGGLVGWNFSLSPVSNCYAAGSVTGIHTLGGLIGWNDGNVSMCYALGAVTGTPALGGLVGHNGGTVNGSYWDTNTTGMATSAGGGTGTNTAAMKQQATFVGWDFDAVWRITENRTYPLLQCFPGSTGLPWLSLLLGQ